MARPGPAIECGECSAVSNTENPHDFDDCPICLSDVTTAVTVSECTAGDDCDADDHHFGIGMHVSEGVQ